MSIYKKLSDFHKEVGTIRKDASNPFHKSKYATIESVLRTIQEPMSKAGLGFTQLPQQDGLKTVIFDVDGDTTIESFVPYILAKDDMQGLGSAITYCRRYALVSMLGLEQEDDDANATIKKQPQPKKKSGTPSSLAEVVQYHKLDKKAFYAFANVDSPEAAKALFNDKGALSQMLEDFKNKDK